MSGEHLKITLSLSHIWSILFSRDQLIVKEQNIFLFLHFGRVVPKTKEQLHPFVVVYESTKVLLNPVSSAECTLSAPTARSPPIIDPARCRKILAHSHQTFLQLTDNSII